jgi:alkylation response protein AidB-like acyl-CoA dehydrogenase
VSKAAPLNESVVTEWLEASWSLDLTLAEWWDRLFDAGFAFPSWPEGLGGFGAAGGDARAVTAALAAAAVIRPPAGNGPNMGGPTLIKHATAEQQHRFVAAMARGKQQWCQLFSEPGAGSDLASLAHLRRRRRRAHPGGEGRVLRGGRRQPAFVRGDGHLGDRHVPGAVTSWSALRRSGRVNVMMHTRPTTSMRTVSVFEEIDCVTGK